MTPSPPLAAPPPASFDIDPRRSLAAAAMWLIIGLALTFSIAAAVWVGRIARENVVEQHVRRLALETDQLSSDLGQAVASRLDAVRAARSLLRSSADAADQDLGGMFEELAADYPELEWLAIADARGTLVNSRGDLQRGSSAASSRWFIAGLDGPWLGSIGASPAFGDLSAPIKDGAGRTIGVIAAHISARRTPDHPLRLTDESDPRGITQAYVLDRSGRVLIGPRQFQGTLWGGSAAADPDKSAAGAPRFERLPDGRRVLVSRSPVSASGVKSLGWQAQLCEPIERVYQRADALEWQILWVSLGLGAATALLGTIGALHLTRRLKRLTHSVAAAGLDAGARIEIPPGQDEVARLADAFAKVHGDLQQERGELKALSGELERRVAVRTREVERLAEESRYAAIVRERLTIARDLHDTLAHSMMAMLSEIRFLRKLHGRDPASIPAELARAEAMAHEGLKEARSAITQMRVSAVRETGLGPALSNEFDRCIDRTGLIGEFTAEAAAAGFGDERAESILRMAQETLRNVERHARATRLTVSLQSIGSGALQLTIEDNGVGFDPQVPSPGHYGLVGLREQADLIGAQLTIESSPNEGTRVTVSWSLSPIAFGKET
jgi:signal transduction histidine kinase